MKKAFAIAIREYTAAVKTKAFVISVVLLPVMLVATVGIRQFTERLSDVTQRRYGIVDRTPGQAVFDGLNAAVQKRNQSIDPKEAKPMWTLERITPSLPNAISVDRQRVELSDRVRGGKLAGFIEIGANALTPAATPPADQSQSILLQTNNPTYLDFREFAIREINQTVRFKRFGDAGIPRTVVEPLLKPVPAIDGGLAAVDGRTGAVTYDRAQSGVIALMVPFALVILMFMVVIVGAIPMMQGVIEEKQQRIAEVLLASVRPFELMLGKLMGMTAVSLTLIALYGIGGAWSASRFQLSVYIAAYVTPSLVLWFLVMQVLAVLMFGSMYIAVGASCTDMKEAQSLLLPLNLLIMLPLMLVFDVIQHPSGPVARWLSFFPTAAPMLTIARIAVPPGIPLWEKVVPVLIVALTTVVFVWAAGRIFRVGIMAGRAASFPLLMKWVIRG